MLVLGRKLGESIIIDPDGPNRTVVTVTMFEPHRGQVRLGIDAPYHIVVHRAEVQRRIEADREADFDRLAQAV